MKLREIRFRCYCFLSSQRRINIKEIWFQPSHANDKIISLKMGVYLGGKTCDMFPFFRAGIWLLFNGLSAHLFSLPLRHPRV